MSEFKNKLKEYINDSYYNLLVLEFFEAFDHLGKCGKKEYRFYSELYKQYKNNKQWKNNIFKRISDREIELYFSMIFSDSQLFAVIFAYSNNLTEQQIHKIANLNNFRRSWSILNKFLCEKLANEQNLNYYAVIDGIEIPAKINKHKQYIKLVNSDITFKII